MKYPQLVSMPSAVSDWLEEQLEARGIDAVVYTRYILSLLHSDTVDVIYSDEDLHFSHLKKEVRRSGGNRKRFRRSADWWRHAQADAEKLKRSAAVECLMSASEQSCGIESLIDELCEKLNEIKSDHTDPPTKKNAANPSELQQVSPQELAKRYYAAFPPLDRNSTSSPTKLISLIPKWIPSPKKKSSTSSVNNSNSHNHHHHHNRHKQNIRSREDMMKSNRVGKQRGGVYGRMKEIGGGARNAEWNKKSQKQQQQQHQPQQKEQTDRQVTVNNEWNLCEEVNMYDDLPVDIKELLDDSPSSHDVTVEMMNLANMRDTGRRGFIPCGTNITSSIWTNEAAMEEDTTLFDNTYNAALNDSVLDLQFSSITINTNWSSGGGDYSFIRDNERNIFLEEQKWDLPPTSGRWSEDSGCFEDDRALNHFTLSLIKLNHTKEESAFAEVVPKNRVVQQQQQQHSYNPFSKIIGSGLHRDASLKTIDTDKEKDDLLTSVHSHFRPINEKADNAHLQSQYADGATFVVSNNWDKINYMRTESGAMYMESDYSMRKKYCEYKMKNGPKNVEFVLKYLVCQNDKGCQTDDVDAEVEAINQQCAEEREEEKHDGEEADGGCTCRTLEQGGDCTLHSATIQPDTATLAELLWRTQQSCDKCNDSATCWNTDASAGDVQFGWQFGTMSKIWSGGVVCHSCLGRPPSTLQHSKLREDVSQDGDQLLSDLSTIQKTYMQENLPPMAAELTCDITGFLLPKERKRRHSLIVANAPQEDTWSFASRLEEDCIIQMSTIPTLRSVTL